MIKGVVFDIDGTLLDSTKIWEDVGWNLLQRRGIAADKKCLKRTLLPMSIEEGAEYLEKRFSLKESQEEIIREMLHDVARFYDEEVQPKPGALALLAGFHRAGIPMAVATANDGAVFHKAFERLGMTEYFQTTVSCHDVGFPKGYPRVYLRAAEIIGTLPEDTIVFEDTLRGLKTAALAGFHTVGVKDIQSRDSWKELEEVAQLMLDSLEEREKINDSFRLEL